MLWRLKPGIVRTGSGATNDGALVGSKMVWSSGLCMPLTSLANILLQEIPADVLYPTSACAKQKHRKHTRLDV